MTTAVASTSEQAEGQTPQTASSRRLLSSFLSLAAGNLAGQVIGFIGVIVVTRELGPRLFGSYGFANGLSGYFALPLMGGLTVIGVRDLARDPSLRRRIVAEVELLMLLNAVVAYAALFWLAPLLSPDHLVQSLLRLLGLNLIINGFTLDWVIQARQRMRWLAALRLAGQVVYIIVLLLVIIPGRTGATRYAICNLIGAGTTALLAIGYVVRQLGFGGQRSTVALGDLAVSLIRRLRVSFSAGIGLVMITVYFSCDVILLGFLRGSYAVGEYTAAEKLPAALAAFSTIWVTVLYPHASVLFSSARDRLRRQVGTFTTLSLLVALPCIPIGFLLGVPILSSIFGARFAAAQTAFAFLLCSAGAGLVNANLTQLLLVCNAERIFTRCVAAGAIVNLTLNLLLIPLWGWDGSACATVVAELVVIACALPQLTRRLGSIDLLWPRLGKALLPLLGLSAGLLILRPLVPWEVVLAASGIVYVLLVHVSGSLRLSELRSLMAGRSPAVQGKTGGWEL